jgi:hypothetical protein
MIIILIIILLILVLLFKSNLWLFFNIKSNLFSNLVIILLIILIIIKIIIFVTQKIIFLILILSIIVKIIIFTTQIILFLIPRILRTQIIIKIYIKNLNSYKNNNNITQIIISFIWISWIIRKIIVFRT